MPATTDNAVHRNTPTVTVLDSRGLVARTIRYHRHPDTPTLTQPRITRQHHDAKGFMSHSSDPRLHERGRVNYRWLTDLIGNSLRTHSVDAGVSFNLGDAAGRPLLALQRIAIDDAGKYDRSQAVVRHWHYESASLPGRLLGISEQASGQAACRIERLVYAGNGELEKAHNLAGQPSHHYDTAGLLHTQSISLTGEPLVVTRRLLDAASEPDVTADWQGEQAAQWNAQLQPIAHAHTTVTRVDATGQVVSTLDAAGHGQRQAYDVAGMLKSSWLTLKGGREQVILESVSYSAAGQKLREAHGNGLVTLYDYEPRTQRLAATRTERPVGHAHGAKVLQDLRYAYDPVGNVVSVRNDAEQTRFWRNQKVEPQSEYAYDSLYQLASVTGREMANAGQRGVSLPQLANLDSVTYTRYSRTYTYDMAGNLTRIRHSAPASHHNYTTEITVSDRSNRAVDSSLTPYPANVEAFFTASGQQTALLPGQPLVWTPRDELHSVTPVPREGAASDRESYRYDIGNQRILKVNTSKTATHMRTQHVVYLPGLELRSTRHGEALVEALQVVVVGEAGGAQVRALQWTAGKPAELANAQLRYSYADHLGSATLEVDGQGAVISQEAYYPFGGTATWAARSEVQGRYKFVRYSGKERDATGLYYYGYRYYQPWLGRWLSADPAGAVDGLNLFTMVRNNPMSSVDEQGLMLKSVTSWLGYGAQQDAPAASAGEGASSEPAPSTPPPSPGPSREGDRQEVTPATAASDEQGEAVRSNTDKNRKRNQARKAAKQRDADIKRQQDEDQARRAAQVEQRQQQRAQQREQKVVADSMKQFGTPWLNPEIFEKLKPRLPTDRQGNLESIKAIGQRPDPANPSMQEFVFLELGNSSGGGKHVFDRHRKEFNDQGINTDKKIIELIMTAMVHGQRIAVQGGKPGRPVYEVGFEGKNRFVAINRMQLSGGILGANPKAYVTASERARLPGSQYLR